MKPWWKSKTTWINIVTIALGAIGSIVNTIAGNELFGLEEQTTVALFIVGIIGLVLRAITKEPLGL